MPPHILDFPDEVLDICLRELLPPIAVEYHEGFSVSDPHDLKGLMALCKTMYRLVLPWVWRHVELTWDGRWSSTGPMMSSGQWIFLRDHPEVASHIRVFALDITFDTEEENVVPSCAFIPLMKNLRVLRFSTSRNAIWDLLIPLLSRPHLHTLIIDCYMPPKVIQSLSSFDNLRRLHIQQYNGTETFLLEKSRSLESFMISSTPEDSPIPWTTMPIPWATLRELTVYDENSDDSYDWYLILENYSSWKKFFPDTPSWLTELFIVQQSCLTLEHVKLLVAFGSQLRILWLAYLIKINQEILDHIVDGFPYLHELHLLSLLENKVENITWSVEPRAIAESFGKLSVLKSLNLNYIDPSSCEERDSKDWHHSVVLHVIPVIGRACHSLETLKFYHNFPEGEICYAILRDNNGGYESYLEREVDISVFRPLTSGWDMGDYSCI